MASKQVSASVPEASKPFFKISPPLLNSANPWATSYDDLLNLYNCPHTGAVTIRTCLLQGFEQDASTHQYTFFSTRTGHGTARVSLDFPEGRGEVVEGETSSLNTLGYSPISFSEYMSMLVRLSRDLKSRPGPGKKPFIVSVTGSASEVAECCKQMLKIQNTPKNSNATTTTTYPEHGPDASHPGFLELMMELNLSCPNIPDKPPPAYDAAALTEYISAISAAKLEATSSNHDGSQVPLQRQQLHVGIKTPPYTYQGQFQMLIEALEDASSKLPGGCPISFITATNTLGSCLVVNADNEPALASVSGSGIGGLAGDALHPVALGNVRTIRAMLDASPHADVRRIAIIGVGGVSDAAGYKRMRSVGAAAVGVGTALGREGVSIFSKIAEGLSKRDIE